MDVGSCHGDDDCGGGAGSLHSSSLIFGPLLAQDGPGPPMLF